MKLYKCEICGNIIEKVIDKGVPGHVLRQADGRADGKHE